MKKYPFPLPPEKGCYDLFPPSLEDDPCVLFHSTAENNLQSIIENGFRSYPPLDSVSYAKRSTTSLAHWVNKRPSEPSENGVVIAVRFESLNVQGIAVNNTDIHIYKKELQPKIIGYCVVPSDYMYT